MHREGLSPERSRTYCTGLGSVCPRPKSPLPEAEKGILARAGEPTVSSGHPPVLDMSDFRYAVSL